LTLATFTDGNANASPSDYSVTINWGDGSGTMPWTLSPSVDGVYSVSGAHPYSQNGSYTATVTVTDVEGATATATSTVVVGDVYAGVQSNLTVATFQDSNSSVQASQFTATIQWGDGKQSSGTVVGGNGVFRVQGTHTYAVDSIDQPGGVYAVSVTITDPSGNTLTSSSGVAVVRPTVAVAGEEVLSDAAGVVSDQVVAAFTEPDTRDLAGEFVASIAWGDGSSTSGTIVEISSGLFQVVGSHSYASLGDYVVAVTLSQGWNTEVPMARTPATAAASGTSNAHGVDDWYAIPEADLKAGKPLTVDGTKVKGFLANDENLSELPKDTNLEIKTFEVNGGTVKLLKNEGKVSDLQSLGTFTFTVGAGWNGSGGFMYQVWVGNQMVDQANVTIGIQYSGFTYFIDAQGDPKNVNTNSKGGMLLVGGGFSVAGKSVMDNPFTWMIQHANGNVTPVAQGAPPPKNFNQKGGDIVVLSASTDLVNATNTANAIRQAATKLGLALNSVETIQFNSNNFLAARNAAMAKNGLAEQFLNNAEAIFIDGGDQSQYWGTWRNSQIQAILNAKIGGNKTVVGGTSAGMAILGGVDYVPAASYTTDTTTGRDNLEGGSGVSSQNALTKAYEDRINDELKTGFINTGLLSQQNVVTDTHFGPDDRNTDNPDPNLKGRMGRSVAFLALMMLNSKQAVNAKTKTPHGLAAQGATAVVINTTAWKGVDGGEAGIAVVDGDPNGAAYFLTAGKKKPQYVKNAGDGQYYLNFTGVQVVKANKGQKFNLDDWKNAGGTATYTISAKIVNGRETLVRDDAANDTLDVYNNPLK
jgi:cyanophycinase-like exopeptidase